VRKLLVRTLLGGLGILVLGTLILVAAGLRDDVGKADVAVVLGSKVEADGTPSPRLRARLDKTVELYQAGAFPLVIASGGTGKEGFDEAKVMTEYLVAHGIPGERVIKDGSGATTYSSARFAAKIVRERRLGSVFVISQYFHVPRSCLALRRFGVPMVLGAHARHFELRDFYSAPREFVAWCCYLVRRY